jgi:hypothetical protein
MVMQKLETEVDNNSTHVHENTYNENAIYLVRIYQTSCLPHISSRVHGYIPS